jgi:hypothetical protein
MEPKKKPIRQKRKTLCEKHRKERQQILWEQGKTQHGHASPHKADSIV